MKMTKFMKDAIIEDTVMHLEQDISEAKDGIKRDVKTIKKLKQLKRVI